MNNNTKNEATKTETAKPRARRSSRGTIRKDVSGREPRYRVYISDHYTATGKQKKKYIGSYRTKKEADEQLTLALSNLDKGLPFKFKNTNAGDYFSFWLNEKKRPACRSSATWSWYANLINQHLIPAFGTKQLQDIRADDIQLFLNNMSREDKPKWRTIKGLRDTLSQIFECAIRNDLLMKNPIICVQTPRPPKKTEEEEYKAFPMELRVRLLQAAAQSRVMKPILYTLLFMGLRIGELLALDWRCVDFEARTLRIDHAVQRHYVERSHYEEKMGVCKTAGSIRTNVLSGAAYDAILEWHDYLASLPDGKRLVASNAPVFPSTKSWERRTYGAFRSSYRHFLLNNHLPQEHMNLHRFRHTAATILLEYDKNPKLVQDFLGHADIRTTLQTYSHVSQQVKKQTAQAMDEAFADLTTSAGA